MRELNLMRRRLCVLMLLFFTITIYGQNKNNSFPDSLKKKVILDIKESILKNYVFPEVAKEIVTFIDSKYQNGEYNKINDPYVFVSNLTDDLQKTSRDKHLGLTYEVPKDKKKDNLNGTDSLAEVQFLKYAKQSNYGFNSLKILNGNIGYLNLTQFYATDIAGETAISAMKFFTNVDALIIDLRQNNGGDPQMIQLLLSCFLPANTHLNDFYSREENTIQQFWTLPYIDFNRRLDLNLYILIGKQTFSAAEEFAYNLKALKRAKLLGDTTGGGAHPVKDYNLTGGFSISIPFARAVNPITKTNWEGVGVIPDIIDKSDDILITTQIIALKDLKLKNKSNDSSFYEWYLTYYKAIIKNMSISNSVAKSICGKYEGRNVVYNENKIYYQKSGGEMLQLIPLDEFNYIVIKYPDFRIKFNIVKGKVESLEGYYDMGFRFKKLRIDN